MDGTLTVAMHDFAGFKQRQGLPPDAPILESMADMPPARAAALGAALDAWEHDLAHRAQPAPGAASLLALLRRRGHRVAVLTRNLHALARITLDTAGLGSGFADADLIGRDDAPPKPDPAGVLRHLARWGAGPDEAVVVGDTHFDMDAGRAAGTATVLVGPAHPPGEVPDLVVDSLAGLDALLRAR